MGVGLYRGSSNHFNWSYDYPPHRAILCRWVFRTIFRQGFDVMRSGKNRSFLPTLLVPVLLVVSAIAVLATQEGRTQSVRATNWSDPATWPEGKVPAAGDKVTIARDKSVLLDVSPPALNGLTIDGKLSFSNNADLELTTEWIMLHGELEIGSEASPHTRN